MIRIRMIAIDCDDAAAGLEALRPHLQAMLGDGHEQLDAAPAQLADDRHGREEVIRVPVQAPEPAPAPAPDCCTRPAAAALAETTPAKTRERGRLVECQEKGWKVMSLEDAADMAGVAVQSIRSCCSPSAQESGRTKAGGFHWRWHDPERKGADPHEARPRHSLSDSMPINPNRVGGSN